MGVLDPLARRTDALQSPPRQRRAPRQRRCSRVRCRRRDGGAGSRCRSRCCHSRRCQGRLAGSAATLLPQRSPTAESLCPACQPSPALRQTGSEAPGRGRGCLYQSRSRLRVTPPQHLAPRTHGDAEAGCAGAAATRLRSSTARAPARGDPTEQQQQQLQRALRQRKGAPGCQSAAAGSLKQQPP
jgi:hypothetical protein